MPPPTKTRDNEALLLELASDAVRDGVVKNAPSVAWKATSYLERLRRLAQIGTVPGAARMAQAAKGAASTGARKISLLGRAPAVGAALEIGKGVHTIMTPPTRTSFDEEADAGEELRGTPAWHQAANFVLSPADALSKYGAASQREGKKAFEASVNPPEMQAIRADVLKRNEEILRAAEAMKGSRHQRQVLLRK